MALGFSFSVSGWSLGGPWGVGLGVRRGILWAYLFGVSECSIVESLNVQTHLGSKLVLGGTFWCSMGAFLVSERSFGAPWVSLLETLRENVWARSGE